jgi:hypothetical protein
MTVTHLLKTWPPYFQEIIDGNKTFDIRKNDRNFKTGDLIVFEEFALGALYTGRKITKRIGYILEGQWGLPKGICCLSLLPEKIGE